MPVGARRCVHCRTLIGDAEEGSTRLGFGSSRHEEASAAEADYGNSTSFGRPGSSFSSGMDENDKRSGMMGGNDAPHQTMLGLGPISSSASRRLFDDATERGGFAQTTISGMPGISFDTNRQSLRGAMNLNNMGPSQMRTPAREINPVSMGIPAPSEVRRSSPHEVVAESLMGVSFDEPAKPVEIAPQKVEIKPEPAVPESDPFANLPGVAPKPSSLVDEEFVDLTSKLFGDDFAAGTKEEDLEDDGWDFDLPDEPAKPEPAKPEPAKPEPAKPEPVAVSNAAAPAAAAVAAVKSSEAPAAKSDTKSDDAADKPKPAAAVSKSNKDDAVDKDEKKDSKPGASISPSQLMAAAACLLGFVWIVLAFVKGGAAEKGFAVGIAFALISSFIGLSHTRYADKLGNMLWTALLLVGALLFFAAATITGVGKAIGQPLLFVAAALELICCGIALFKKH